MSAVNALALVAVGLGLLTWGARAQLGVHSAVGHSYALFHGPVEGPEQQIHATVPGPHGKHVTVLDYVAHPKYQFEYGVEDPHSGDFKQQKESRDGDHVEGEYSLTQPDGNIRTVKYVADDHGGFQAFVTYSKHGAH